MVFYFGGVAGLNLGLGTDCTLLDHNLKFTCVKISKLVCKSYFMISIFYIL